MADLEAATAAQLRNIEESTGRSLAQWSAVIADAGLSKHSEVVAYLKSEHGLTHGNANLLAHKARDHAQGGPASDAQLLADQYAGAKQHLLPTYEAVVAAAGALGNDVVVVVQKTGVSLRRAKQFGLVQAPSAKRVEVGMNLGDMAAAGLLEKATGMCTHRVNLTSPSDVDDEVVAWLRAAYDRAG